MVSGGERAWQRVGTLDPEVVVRQIRQETGVALRLEGLCPGGQVGAAYVRWDDGRPGVLTWRETGRLAELRRGPLAVPAVLRRHGYPAPAVLLALQVGDGVALVQELLPGTTVDVVTAALMDQALALNEAQAGRLVGGDVPAVRLHLHADGPGYCLHGPLRAHSRRSRRLLGWVGEVAEEHPGALPGDDAVHTDFHPGNLLAVGERITGVVDWEGAGRGDRRFDLVTLRFGVHGTRADPAAVERLDRLVDELPQSLGRAAWAHMSLRMVDWSIRHFSAEATDRWLDLAETKVA